jgi:branched-chain amino acid transport system permease protein
MTEVLQHIIDGLSFGSLYALFALGIALIFGIMGLLNFAHGELIMTGGFTMVLLSSAGWIVMILGTLVVVVVVALLIERVAFRPVRGADPITLLVTSFALSYLLQHLAEIIFGSVSKSVDVSESLSSSIHVGSLSIPKLDLITIAVTLLLMGGLTAFLARTRMGVQMRAAAESFSMARLLGVRANNVIALAFMLSGVLAAVASLLLVAQTGAVTNTIGASPVLVAFIATVLGGIGSLRGAVLGGFLLGFLTVALASYLPLELRYYRDAFVYTAVIAMLLLRPQGLIVAKNVVTRI